VGALPLELIGPAALTVALLYVVYGKVISDPPKWYSRREYADLEGELKQAEDDRDWYYREALEANGVSGKALELVRRREIAGGEHPPVAPPPGPWDQRGERTP
jgi:hypothetical protein